MRKNYFLLFNQVKGNFMQGLCKSYGEGFMELQDFLEDFMLHRKFIYVGYIA